MGYSIKIGRKKIKNVGATGFEPATTWSQTRSATGLRYTPLFCDCKGIYYFSNIFIIINIFLDKK